MAEEGTDVDRPPGQNPSISGYNTMVLAGDSQRDNAAEMRLGALMEEEKIPVERSLEQWYALWEIPF